MAVHGNEGGMSETGLQQRPDKLRGLCAIVHELPKAMRKSSRGGARAMRMSCQVHSPSHSDPVVEKIEAGDVMIRPLLPPLS
eukprot:6656954-Pyramimonas_sp.AAC.1